MNLSDVFLYQFVVGTNCKVEERKKDTILVTCNIIPREDKNYLWGAEKYAIKICEYLSKKYKVHLFQQAKNFLNLEDVIVHSDIDIFFSKDKMKSVANKVKNVSPKCIFCNAGSGEQALYWTIISKMTNVPIIMFFHNEPFYILKTINNIWGMEYIKNQKIFQNPQQLYDIVLEKCDVLGFLLPQYIDDRFRQKSKVFYNCIELPTDVEVEKERKNILYVGRINSNTKRTHLLLNAVNNTDYPCYVIGHSYCDMGYVDCSKYKSPNFHFEGYKENVGYYYRQAKVLVIPSLIEGLPTVALEAFSYGVPVLGFKECKSLNHIINNQYNGWIIENGLKEKIDEIMHIEDMKNIRYNCIKESKKYDVNTIMKKIEESIRDVQ